MQRVLVSAIGKCSVVSVSISLLAAMIATVGSSEVHAAPDVPIPPPAAAVDRDLDETEARTVAAGILGAVPSDLREDRDAYRFKTSGLVAGRSCPLDGVRDVRCGEFEYVPSRVTVHRRSLVAAVSGHLARNRVVLVDLDSDDAPLAFGSLHGILVFPTEQVRSKDRPAFAWYLSRLGRGISLDMRDVDGNGTLDLVYTYSQLMSGGVRILARDVWTVDGLQAVKLISSGEKLSGVYSTTFEGVPLLQDGDGWMVRGSWNYQDVVPGMPPMVVLDRVSLGIDRATWDLHVLADLGEGWREILAGTSASRGEQGYGSDEDDPNCLPGDVQEGLHLDVRRRLLDLEAACRHATGFLRSGSEPMHPVQAFRAASRARSAGLRAVALGLQAYAAERIVEESPRSWPLTALLSLPAVVTAMSIRNDAFRPSADKVGPYLPETMAAFQALRPLVVLVEIFRVVAGAIRIPGLASPDTDAAVN
jgi:hypothetical protein